MRCICINPVCSLWASNLPILSQRQHAFYSHSLTVIELYAHVVRRLNNSVPWPIRSLVGGVVGMKDDSAEIFFQYFLQKAPVSSSGMGRDVHSLMLFIQVFPCRPRRRPPSKVPWRMVLERLSWHVTCTSHTSSNFWPFMLISALMLFVLLFMISLFSVMTSNPYAVALSMSLLVRSRSSPLLPFIRSMSSANRRLHVSLPPMEMDVWWS